MKAVCNTNIGLEKSNHSRSAHSRKRARVRARVRKKVRHTTKLQLKRPNMLGLPQEEKNKLKKQTSGAPYAIF